MYTVGDVLGRHETTLQTLIPAYCIYKALRKRFKGHTSSLLTAASVRAEYRIFRFEIYKNDLQREKCKANDYTTARWIDIMVMLYFSKAFLSNEVTYNEPY